MSGAARSVPQSQVTTFDVGTPWAWFWWPASVPLRPANSAHPVHALNPDIDDDTVRYPNSTVDWALIARTVTAAVNSHGGTGEDLLDPKDAPFDAPVAFTVDERRIVNAWLNGGVGRAVRIAYFDDGQPRLSDGRHRLHATWHHFADLNGSIPLRSDLHFNLQELRASGYDPAWVEIVTVSVQAEQDWWDKQPATVQDLNRAYLRHLMYLSGWLTDVRASTPVDVDRWRVADGS